MLGLEASECILPSCCLSDEQGIDYLTSVSPTLLPEKANFLFVVIETDSQAKDSRRLVVGLCMCVVDWIV